jgi:hypothetical protein
MAPFKRVRRRFAHANQRRILATQSRGSDYGVVAIGCDGSWKGWRSGRSSRSKIT